jgi:hypothetical protein
MLSLANGRAGRHSTPRNAQVALSSPSLHPVDSHSIPSDLNASTGQQIATGSIPEPELDERKCSVP